MHNISTSFFHSVSACSNPTLQSSALPFKGREKTIITAYRNDCSEVNISYNFGYFRKQFIIYKIKISLTPMTYEEAQKKYLTDNFSCSSYTFIDEITQESRVSHTDLLADEQNWK